VALPSAGNVFLDTTQFYAVIDEYVKASHKDYALAVNLKMRDAALRAAQHAPVASRDNIRYTIQPPLIAYFLRHRPLKTVNRRLYSKEVKTKTGNVRRKWIKRNVKVHYTRAEARKYARSILGRRVRARTFIKGFFVGLASAIENKSQGVPKGARNYKTGFNLSYVPAVPDRLKGEGKVEYLYKHAKETDNSGSRLLQKAWDFGLGAVIEDMKVYIARKMKERAYGHSMK
jgi:hypothetical protein